MWKSGYVKRLLQGCDFKTITFLQGPLGRPYAKPTTFLVARMPDLAFAIFREYQPFWRPTQVLGGRNADGKTWATSAAKEYPQKLCQIMATEFLRYHDVIQTHGHCEFPDELQIAIDSLTSWDPYMTGVSDQMRADYDMKASVRALS